MVLGIRLACVAGITAGSGLPGFLLAGSRPSRDNPQMRAARRIRGAREPGGELGRWF